LSTSAFHRNYYVFSVEQYSKSHNRMNNDRCFGSFWPILPGLGPNR